MATIRDSQLGAVKSMLSGKTDDDDFETLGAVAADWKVLVYDKIGQDILTPLLTVQDLHELGVTLYLQLHAPRDHIPDTTVVYFVQPTADNVQRICKDIETQLYDKYELNFLSAVPRQLLEDIAAATIASGSAVVSKIFDLFVDFLSLEKDFFALRKQNPGPISYTALSSPDTDADIMDSMEQVVAGLFCAVVTMGVVPIIRCSRGNAAEEIAKKLAEKLRSALKQRNGVFSDSKMSASGSFQRPLLALVDRNVDLGAMLQHTWTYQALVHDVMDYHTKLNRIVLPAEGGGGGAGQGAAQPAQSFDLDSSTDVFWSENRGLEWVEVAEASQQQLQQVSQEEESIRPMANGGGGGGAGIADGTAKIKEAVAKLPILMKKKKQLDQHMSVLSAAVKSIEARALNEYFELEGEILNDDSPASAKILELLGASAKGSAQDKLRLLSIYMLSAGAKPETVIAGKDALKGQGVDLGALVHVEEVKKHEKLASHRKSSAASSASSQDVAGKAWAFGGQALGGMSKLLAKGVKKLHVAESEGVVTQIVDDLMDNRSTALTKDYLFIDPKVLKGGDKTEVPERQPAFAEAVTFMVGGGGFLEYQGLVSAMAKKGKVVTYGCTSLVNATTFLQQMAACNK